MTLYVGTSGWSYPRGRGSWDGIFYPKKMPDPECLTYYSQFFNTVEINSSFYRPPNEAAARSWAEKVPADFRFSVKLWQKFTHPRMFEAATGDVARVAPGDFDEFLTGIRPLLEADKLGPLLAQFPVSFKPDAAGLSYLENLILRLREERIELAVELRHKDWTALPEANPVRALMRSQNVAWVMIDEPRFQSAIRNIPLTSDLGYFRFHGRNYEQWWHHEASEDRYNYYYKAREQAGLAEDVTEIAQRTRATYAYYNNHYGAKAAANAMQLQVGLGGQLRQPPPDTLLRAFPDLEELVSQNRE